MFNGYISVNFTVGFGNNLFQYVFARLLAEKNNFILLSPDIPELGISKTESTTISRGNYGEKLASPEKSLGMRKVTINDRNAYAFFNEKLMPAHYIISGYFEDYRFYKNHLEKIRSWFPQVEKTNSEDVILHMRLQNRLIQKGHHKHHITPQAFIDGLSNFNYKKIHIITDSKKWEHYDEKDILELRKQVSQGPGSHSEWVDIDRSLYYMNSLVGAFAKYNPIVHCAGDTIPKSGALADNFMKDFNFIRSFNNIMIFNSTFSWWAALLSDAENVGTYGPWKANKTKNLGQTTFPGWFSWGSKEDLYWR